MVHSSDTTDQSHSNQPPPETASTLPPPSPPTATTATTNHTNNINNNNNAGPAVPMGYPPPYQPYSPPQNYPYYYPNQQPYYTYPPTGVVAGPSGSGGGSSSGFVRGFLAIILAVIIITCVASIVTWLILRPQVPIFRVETLSITNLNTSIPQQFAAKWDANVTTENPNKKLRIYLERARGFVYHNEELMGSSGVDPVFLPTRSSETLEFSVKANNTEDHSVGRWVVDQIVAERAAGAVVFNIRMMVRATFKSGEWWTKHASMKVLCDGLAVNFIGNETSGLLAAAQKSTQCMVYYA